MAFLHRHEFAVLLLCAPLFLFPGPTRGAALLLLPVLALAARRSGAPIVPPTPLNAPMAWFTAAVLIGGLVTAAPPASLGKLVGALYSIACFFAVVRLVGDRHALDRVPRLMPWVVGAFATFALLTTRWIPKFGLLGAITDRLPRLLPSLSGADGGLHPNPVAGTLTLLIPLQLLLAVSAWRRRHAAPASELWAHGAALLISVIAVVLAQSRGAWIGLAIGVAGLAWIASGRRARLALTGAAVCGAAVALAVATGWPVAARDAMGPGIEGDITGRLGLWNRGLAALADVPFTGFGLDGFRRAEPVMYPTTLVVPDLRQEVVHVHQHFLQVALDLGVPGLVIYLALWTTAARLFAAALRVTPRSDDGRLLAGLAMGLLSYAVFGLGDAVAIGAKLGLLFWMVLGLAVGALLVVRAESER